MSQLFQSSGYFENTSESSLGIDLPSLPAFLRVLLTTDGTVTKSLESFFWEPVQVQCCRQDYILLDRDEAVIQRQSGSRVLQREVALRGCKTGTEYATAKSLICTELLEPLLRKKLETGGVGVGELLRDLGLETYREIIAVGEGQGVVWRLYRIVMGHQPFIQIRESFPTHVYV